MKEQYIFNQFEGQIDTRMMMDALLKKVQTKGIKILNNCIVESFLDDASSVKIKTNQF